MDTSDTRIPCSVGILTRNSEKTLGRALESVRKFRDVFICDGGSSDGTHAIARTFGARILAQSSEHLDPEGKIVDYGGVRNQQLAVATEEWFLYLDSDEYLTPALVEEIGRAVSGTPKAFWIRRMYTWGGREIMCSTTYPNKQMRLFHRHTAKGFIKKVHERIERKEGSPVSTLEHFMVVPMDTTKEALWRKWNGYIALEVARHTHLTRKSLIRISYRHARSSLLYLLRHIRMLLMCRGARLPVWRELAEHRYNYEVVRALWKHRKEAKTL